MIQPGFCITCMRIQAGEAWFKYTIRSLLVLTNRGARHLHASILPNRGLSTFFKPYQIIGDDKSLQNRISQTLQPLFVPRAKSANITLRAPRFP